ncbi:MAG: hypothetical protein ACK5HM_08300 [Gemmatimonas sp.]|uniref:hypothetical protein n=1 Tax=Gemmatimonas sp. TaxID=1962908 RepID=UPI0022CCE4A6|nr:hypothetical protein [Gemmatimonas sp.]MCZ8012020.1 hypothetical protein [Gemmatimonas sp.]
MTQVFKKFQPVWPTSFQAPKWPALLESWLDNCEGVDTDVLEVAARDFIRSADHKFPPKPWEFGKFARSLQREKFGSSPLIESVAGRREWEWISPFTRRIVHVTMSGTDWVTSSMDDYAAFGAMDDAQRVEHCEEMVRAHGQGLKRTE